MVELVIHPEASMRPRHKAAENARPFSIGWYALRPASMRPRHKAAENAPIVTPAFDVLSGLQ